MRHLRGITLLTLLLSLSAIVNAQELTPGQAEVWEISNKIFTSWKDGNFDEFSGLIHQNYQGWSVHDSLPLSKDEMIDRFKKAEVRYHIESVYRKPVSIVVSKAGALVDYQLYYKLTSRESKDEVAWLIGKNAEFFVKEGDQWLLLGDMSDFIKKEAER